MEAGVGVEGAADFSLLASFFRTASLVLWSAVDETVFLQCFFRKCRSSLVMRLEPGINCVVDTSMTSPLNQEHG